MHIDIMPSSPAALHLDRGKRDGTQRHALTSLLGVLKTANHLDFLSSGI